MGNFMVRSLPNDVQRAFRLLCERVSGAQKGAKSGGGDDPDFGIRANGGASADPVSRQTTS